MGNDNRYQSVAYHVSMAPGGPVFRLAAECRDVTKWGDDATTWHVLENGISYLVTVTGRTALTMEHPLPATEALTMAMLLAVRDETAAILRAGDKLEAGRDYPVTVTREHLSEGEEQAARLDSLREDNAS